MQNKALVDPIQNWSKKCSQIEGNYQLLLVVSLNLCSFGEHKPGIGSTTSET